LLKQALTSSYQAKQEVTATNKSTTVEWSVSVPQQQHLSSCSRNMWSYRWAKARKY